MLFQSGSRTISIGMRGVKSEERGVASPTGSPLPTLHSPLAVWPRRLDLGRHVGAELLEVLAEHLRELGRLRVVSRGVLPGLAGVHDRSGHAWDLPRDVQAEDRVRERLDA